MIAEHQISVRPCTKTQQFPFWGSRITKMVLSHRKGCRKECVSPSAFFAPVFFFFPRVPSGVLTPRLPRGPARARGPLAGEQEQQEQGQVPQAAEEQLPGALPVRVGVEPEAEVGNVQVDRQRDDGEGPRGDLERGRGGRQCDQGQAVAQRDAPAQGRVRDRHHAVAAAGVVFAEAPAQRVEVGELPRVEDPSQEKGSCARVDEKRGVVRGHRGSAPRRRRPCRPRPATTTCQSGFSPRLVWRQAQGRASAPSPRPPGFLSTPAPPHPRT